MRGLRKKRCLAVEGLKNFKFTIAGALFVFNKTRRRNEK